MREPRRRRRSTGVYATGFVLLFVALFTRIIQLTAAEPDPDPTGTWILFTIAWAHFLVGHLIAAIEDQPAPTATEEATDA